MHFERNSNGSQELDKKVNRAFLNQEKEFRGGNMSLVMHIYIAKQKKVDNLMSEVWKMLQCHLLICRMLPLLTQETLEKDWENLINIQH